MLDLIIAQGETEKGLFEIAEAHPQSFEVTVIRPGAILSAGSIIPKLISSQSTDVSVLAAVFVESVVKKQNQGIIGGSDIGAIIQRPG